MAQVTFYERPGCVNNAKQRALLWASGHKVVTHNLLKTPWTASSLRPFFGNLPITEWFNKSAPEIKLGEIVPQDLDEATALQLMIENPLLIRRPLMQVEDIRQIGFDRDRVNNWIGLSSPKGFENLEECPRTH